MKFLAPAALICLMAATSCERQTPQAETTDDRPRLVVGIVVDQMRNDYIHRFWQRFGDGGFRRLVKDGFYFRDAHFNYIPTNTGPGHASVYTGTTPKHHGIIANDWYDPQRGKKRYCVYDDSARTIGVESDAGRMSPRQQLSPTIGDELKLATSGRGKVFAVSLKDRSAVLPAGHAADAAFWLDETKGAYVSSSWYLDQLPSWLQSYNAANPVQRYLSTPWTTLHPIETYTSSLADDNDYENPLPGAARPVFPYDFSEALKANKLSVIRTTPYGNAIAREVALACLENEKLGSDEIADLLCISFSSTDIIGHAYGPRSIEIEDTYLRLDKEIEAILNALDEKVGKGRYTVFLTADHGAGDVASHLMREQIPAGYIYEDNIERILRDFCRQLYKDTAIIADVSNEQVFLNLPRIHSKGYDQAVIEAQLCDMLITMKGIAAAYPSKVLRYGSADKDAQLTLLQNGYHFKRSGHVAFIYEPGFVDYSRKGTTHGSGYTYDTHVPVIFYGAGVGKGESFDKVSITQIAPTVTEILGVARPGASSAQPMNGYWQKP